MFDDELTPEQRFAAEDPSITVPRDLHRGRPKESIVADLIRHDWKPAAAADYVERFEAELQLFRASPEGRRAVRQEQLRYIIGGTALTTLGLFMSLGTLLMAFQGGRIVIVFWGAVMIGIAMLVRGVRGWRRYRRDELQV